MLSSRGRLVILLPTTLNLCFKVLLWPGSASCTNSAPSTNSVVTVGRRFVAKSRNEC